MNSVNGKKRLGCIALVLSLVPLAALVPGFLGIELADEARFGWSIVNVVCVIVGLMLSIACVKSGSSRSIAGIVAMIVSSLFLILMLGIVAFGLAHTYVF